MDDLFTNLKQVLADLYVDPADAKRIAAEAGLDLTQIPFDAKAINHWHNILAVAIRAGALDAVLETALGEYARHQPLTLICERYRRFIADGGQLNAPELLSMGSTITTDGGSYVAGPVTTGGDFIGRDKTVQGDEIHGDKIVYQGIEPRLIDAATLAAARAQLAALPLDHIPAIATLPAGSRMPFSPNPLFVGRTEELRQLAAWIKGGETVSVSQNMGGQMVATTGMGGMGKSQLAAAFVHHYGRYFQGGVFWLTMADPDSIPAQIAECGAQMTELRVDYHQLDLSTQVSLVLAAWQSDLPRLLVFDNCESSDLLAQWRPPNGACRVLVTSRRSHFDAPLGVQALPLPTLPRAQSIELLTKFPANVKAAPYTKEEIADLDKIAAALGDLPLALHLAGSFLARYRRVITPTTYLTQLQTLDSLEHRSLQSKEISPTAHDQHVARTFALSYEQLQANDEIDALALRLLSHIACFAPGELIPRDLLLLTIEQEGEDNTDPLDAAMQAEDALLRLMELGLIEVETDEQILLHRLLAIFVQHVDREGYAAAVSIVETAILREANRLNNRGIPQPLLIWQVHLRHRTDLAKARLDEIAAALCNALGYHLHMIGEYRSAKPYYERALAIRQTVLGDQHPDTASSLNNLGFLLQAMGDYSAARPYYERALIILENRLGSTHPYTELVHNNLAALIAQLAATA
ncbi:MAG: tetratricopeptide repeat protein [Caldilineaceae bacterium]